MASAGLAATDARLFTVGHVAAALEHGRRAAEHGCALPLAAVLDTAAVLHPKAKRALPLRSDPQRTPVEKVAYDDWLRRLAARHRVKLLPGSRTHPYPLPVVVSEWPITSVTEDALKLLEFYHTLAGDPAAPGAIHDCWRGPRTNATATWRKWFEGSSSTPVISPADGLKVRFLEAAPGLPLEESFDHEAASLFFESKDPEITDEQNRRIRRLARRQSSISRHPTNSHQRPAFTGALPLSVLCQDDWDHLVVNTPAQRIGNPISSNPHQRLRIHLCTSHGFNGLGVRTSKAGADGSSRLEESVLRGFVALLVDDWRSALRDLPVDISVHRGRPSGNADLVGRSGRRWKSVAMGRGPFPPPPAVGQLFRRSSWLDPDDDVDLHWHAQRLRNHFWCLCLLAGDLAEAGIRKEDHRLWTSAEARIPACIGRVIILDPESGTGSILRPRPRIEPEGRAAVELTPAPEIGPQSGGGDSSFGALRTRALTMVLSALEAT